MRDPSSLTEEARLHILPVEAGDAGSMPAWTNAMNERTCGVLGAPEGSIACPISAAVRVSF